MPQQTKKTYMTDHKLTGEVEARFDEKFANANMYNSNDKRFREFPTYEELKQFLAQEIQMAVEAADRNIRRDVRLGVIECMELFDEITKAVLRKRPLASKEPRKTVYSVLYREKRFKRVGAGFFTLASEE